MLFVLTVTWTHFKFAGARSTWIYEKQAEIFKHMNEVNGEYEKDAFEEILDRKNRNQ